MIEEYTESAIPVGSKILADKYKFHLSAATIRNNMNELEKTGYLYQPHTSAGRIPTDKGYRFFVEEIMPEQKLNPAEQKKLQAEILKLKAHNQQLSRTAARLMSALSGSLVISGVKKDFYDFGISELLENPEFRQADEFCRIAQALDSIDENIDAILKKVKNNETKIFIGHENPIKEISNCSMVVSPYKNKKGEQGVLAIVGPKRMRYAKNKSLLDYFKKIMGGAAVIIFVINFI